MPQVNLSTLTGQELRQMLDASRRRGDAAQSYQILREMAARREAPQERRTFKRRVGAPHLVAVDMGESVAGEDDLPPMPNWRPPPRQPEPQAAAPKRKAARAKAEPRSRAKTAPAKAAAPAPAAAPVTAATPVAADPAPPLLETERPLSLRDADTGPLHDPAADPQHEHLRLHPAGLESPRAPARVRPPRSSGRPFAGFTLGISLGIALGMGLGWWGAHVARDLLRGPVPAAAPIQTAALAPRPAPAVSPLAPSPAEPPADALPAAEAAPTSAEAAGGAASPADAQAPAADTDTPTQEPAPAASRRAPALPTAEAAELPAERPATAVARGCAKAPTPADREICGDPQLKRLQAQLRRVYNEALDAHQDRTLLRQRQLAWRDARNTVTDPNRLARLYEERIHKLEAATAQARAQR